MSDSARLFVDTKLLLEKAPKQLVIHSPAANNDKLDLPFESSFFNLKAKELPDRDLLCAREGIRMFTPEAALVKASGTFLRDNPVDVRVVAGAIGLRSKPCRRPFTGLSRARTPGRSRPRRWTWRFAAPRTGRARKAQALLERTLSKSDKGLD